MPSAPESKTPSQRARPMSWSPPMPLGWVWTVPMSARSSTGICPEAWKPTTKKSGGRVETERPHRPLSCSIQQTAAPEFFIRMGHPAIDDVHRVYSRLRQLNANPVFADPESWQTAWETTPTQHEP